MKITKTLQILIYSYRNVWWEPYIIFDWWNPECTATCFIIATIVEIQMLIIDVSV